VAFFAAMGIIDKTKRVISSNVNAMLDKAEDPRKMVAHTLEEMKDQLARARQEVISASAAEKQQRAKCDELRANVDRWEQRAVLAVKAGDDALARAALEQKARANKELAASEQRREELLGIALKMRDELKANERKHAALDARKGTIAARAEMAKAGGGVEALGSKGGSSSFEAMRAIESKIDDQEAEVAALDELNEDAVKEAELESKFRRLEGVGVAKSSASAGGVDDELSALKQRVRIGT
jgi:phage shock protein A